MTKENRPATLPRTKSKSHTSATVSQKPSICLFSPVSRPNPSRTPPAVKPKPANSFSNAPDSQSHCSALHSVTQTKPSLSPSLTVPIIPPNLSPTLLCKMMLPGSQGAKRKTIPVVAEKRGVQSIVNSNTRDLPLPAKRKSLEGATTDVLDQDILVNFTRSEGSRGQSRNTFSKQTHHTVCGMTSKNLWPLQCKASIMKVKDNGHFFLDKPEITRPNLSKIVSSLQAAEKKCTQSEPEVYIGKECNSVFHIGSHSLSNLRLPKKYANYLENTQCTLTKSVPETWKFTTDSKTQRSQVEECPVKVTAAKNSCTSSNIKALRRHEIWSGILNMTEMTDDTSLHQGAPERDSKQIESNTSKEQPYLVLNQTQEASQILPLKLSKPVSVQKINQLDRLDLTELPVKSANNQRVTPSYLEPSQLKCIKLHDHGEPTQLPVYSSEKCAVSWLSSTEWDPFNITGTGSNELCKMASQPWETGHQTEVDRAASLCGPTPHKQTDLLPSGAPITEDPEEPYYVTMYSPNPVYVSMGEYGYRECQRMSVGVHCKYRQMFPFSLYFISPKCILQVIDLQENTGKETVEWDGWGGRGEGGPYQ